MQPDVTSARVLKKSQIFSKNAEFMLTLMSKEKLNFLQQIQILKTVSKKRIQHHTKALVGCCIRFYETVFTLQVCMKLAFIVTCSVFLDSE